MALDDFLVPLFIIVMTTTDVVLTTAPDCQWTSIPNAYRRAGGALQPGILNVSAYQSACYARYPNCQEFDFVFNSSSMGCYLTTDNSPLIYEVARMRAHHSISCAIAPGECVWTKVPSVYRQYGGVMQNGITTIEACEAACLSKYPLCTDFDFVNINSAYSQACYFTLPYSPFVHDTSIYKPHLGVFCPLVDGVRVWTSVANLARQSGGIFQPGISTLVGCQSVCLSLYPDCSEFDFVLDSPTAGCWLTKDGSPLIHSTTPKKAHYSVFCPTVKGAPQNPTQTTFQRISSNAYLNDAFLRVDLNPTCKVSQCSARCLEQPQCAGFNLRTQPGGGCVCEFTSMKSAPFQITKSNNASFWGKKDHYRMKWLVDHIAN